MRLNRLFVTAERANLASLQPVANHALLKSAQRTRELYAALLAALLLSGDAVSEAQQQVFDLVLQSLRLEPVAVQAFKLAKKLQATQLNQLLNALKKPEQQTALLLDTLILVRLDAVPNTTQADLLTQIWRVFHCRSETLARIAAVAAMGLGLPYDKDALLSLAALSERLSVGNPVTAPVWRQEWLKYAAETGVWIDPTTGLMWSRINLGQQWQRGVATGGSTLEPLDVLKKECKHFLLAGFEDWRVPSSDELELLKRDGQAGYAVPDGMFYPPDLRHPDDYSAYWSELANPPRPSDAWYVNFDVGKSFPITRYGCAYARLVRGAVMIEAVNVDPEPLLEP